MQIDSGTRDCPTKDKTWVFKYGFKEVEEVQLKIYQFDRIEVSITIILDINNYQILGANFISWS